MYPTASVLLPFACRSYVCMPFIISLYSNITVQPRIASVDNWPEGAVRIKIEDCHVRVLKLENFWVPEEDCRVHKRVKYVSGQKEYDSGAVLYKKSRVETNEDEVRRLLKLTAENLGDDNNTVVVG